MPMPRMLQNLRDYYLDVIERRSDWEYGFICDLCERFEENPNYELRGDQFPKLLEIHQKYAS